MKKLVLYTAFVLSAVLSRAQQAGMYSHYFYKPMIYNPAFTGTDDATGAMLINRSQWTGFKGAPQLDLFTLDGRLANKKVGLGISLVSDRKGLSDRLEGQLAYSYRINFNDDMHLQLGLSAGVVNQTLNYAAAVVETTGDASLFPDMQRRTTFDASAGLGFVWRNLEFGAAVPQLAGNKIKYTGNTDARTYYTQARHYMGSLKYKFILSQDKGLSLTPEALVRYIPGAPFQYDGNLIFGWKEKCWIGATYKSGYAVGANAGICLYRQLYIGYAYDFMIGGIGSYAGTSSELMLNFKFGRNKKKETEETAAVSKEEKENDAVYKKQADSLQDALHESQEENLRNQQKIRELNERLSREKQQGNAAPGNPPAAADAGGNQNAAALSVSTDKTMDSGVWLVAGNVRDYKDAGNRTPVAGFYVIAGTFVYQDFAEAEARRLENAGFKGSSRIYSETKKYNYIFIARFTAKEDAVKKANDAKAAGVKDAWILELKE